MTETASNAGGSGSAAESEATVVVVPPAPVNRTPYVTGSAQQGETLTEQHGEWTNSPTGYAYQWMRCESSGAGCAAIGGATGETYSLVGEDVGHPLRVAETASNAGGAGRRRNRKHPRSVVLTPGAARERPGRRPPGRPAGRPARGSSGRTDGRPPVVGSRSARSGSTSTATP